MTDHIGYPMATISYTGTVQWQPDPEPFGDVISEQSVGSGHDPLIRYPGQWRLDPVLATTEPAFTTLYDNTHRWYNPAWGRYTQSDPIGKDSTFLTNNLPENAFAYGRVNPRRFSDPLGLAATDCCLCPGSEWMLAGELTGWVVLEMGRFEMAGGRLKCLSNSLNLPAKARCRVVEQSLPRARIWD